MFQYFIITKVIIPQSINQFKVPANQVALLIPTKRMLIVELGQGNMVKVLM